MLILGSTMLLLLDQAVRLGGFICQLNQCFGSMKYRLSELELVKELPMDIQLPGLIQQEQKKVILLVNCLLLFLIQAQALSIFQADKLMISYTDY